VLFTAYEPTYGRELWATIALLPPPTNVVATVVTPTSVRVTWSSVDNAGGYEVARSTNGVDYTTVATTNGSTFSIFDPATAGTAYLYKVRALLGLYSVPDLATTFLYTDDPLVAASTFVKAAHVTELRNAIESVRTLAGIGPGSYRDVMTAGLSIHAAHLIDLRFNLDAARAALGLAPWSYTDPNNPATLPIKAVHLTEIRNGVK